MWIRAEQEALLPSVHASTPWYRPGWGWLPLRPAPRLCRMCEPDPTVPVSMPKIPGGVNSGHRVRVAMVRPGGARGFGGGEVGG